MERRFFSQNGEDYVLSQVFDRPGFYVDVGAFDGIHLSNTLSFEQQGWEGICVEAHPEMAALCRKNRSATCIHAACVGDASLASVSFQVEQLGLLSGREVNQEDLRRRYDGRGLRYTGTKTIRVPAITLNGILAGIETIDVISIDVEGTELDVLHGMDFERHRPRVLVIEANDPPSFAALKAYLKDWGYKLARTLRQNCFFASSRTDVRLLRGPVHCVIEANLHPLGEAYTLPEARLRREISEPSVTRRSLVLATARRGLARVRRRLRAVLVGMLREAD